MKLTERIIVLRAVAVHDSTIDHLNPLSPNYRQTTSAPCYCTPTVVLLMSDEGLEDPTAELVPVELIEVDEPTVTECTPEKRLRRLSGAHVRFRYLDGCVYVARAFPEFKLRYQQIRHWRFRDISLES